MSVTELKKPIAAYLRRKLPRSGYQVLRTGFYGARTAVGRNPGRGHLLPDFLIIGTAKSGTTTLHGWLSEHPFVVPAVKKEVHFFDYDWQRGVDFYRTHFPTERERDEFSLAHGRAFLTGETSPTYISHQWAPVRIAKVLPGAKLIVAFRNPIDRAYSQFQMARREDEEPFDSFADAVAAEPARLAAELARSRRDARYVSWPLGNWSYLYRSSYAEQVERWFELFPREQFLFIDSHVLEARPQEALDETYAFLGLPAHANVDLENLHVAPRYDPIPADVRAQLADHFRPHNERLYELVGIDFGWEA